MTLSPLPCILDIIEIEERRDFIAVNYDEKKSDAIIRSKIDVDA
jgi:hypothetical protein